MVYPDVIDTFRATENLPGLVYNANDKRTVFSEDIQKLASMNIAIETELGVNPKGDYDDVAARLTAISNAIASALSAMYPIGSVYTNTTDDTNPATLFGFGTWVALPNVFLVGKGSGTFATIGATGGEETHQLSASEQANMRVYGQDKWCFNTGGSEPGFVFNPAGANNGQAQTWAVGGGTLGNAHNNLPPFKVVYMWERTA